MAWVQIAARYLLYVLRLGLRGIGLGAFKVFGKFSMLFGGSIGRWIGVSVFVLAPLFPAVGEAVAAFSIAPFLSGVAALVGGAYGEFLSGGVTLATTSPTGDLSAWFFDGIFAVLHGFLTVVWVYIAVWKGSNLLNATESPAVVYGLTTVILYLLTWLHRGSPPGVSEIVFVFELLTAAASGESIGAAVNASLNASNASTIQGVVNGG